MTKVNINECRMCGEDYDKHTGLFLWCPTGSFMFKRKYEDDGSLYTANRDEPTCPWCGYTDPDHWEYTDEDDWEINCGRCDKPIQGETEITYTYTTIKGTESE